MITSALGSTVVTISQPERADAAGMWRIAHDAGTLDANSSYAYLMWCDHFRTTSAVARIDGEVIGFVAGFALPERPDAIMVWQIAVAAGHRGKGVALDLLDAVIEPRGAQRFRWLLATVAHSNHQSRALFAALADRRNAAMSRTAGYEADEFPDAHEGEDLCTVGPFIEQTIGS